MRHRFGSHHLFLLSLLSNPVWAQVTPANDSIYGSYTPKNPKSYTKLGVAQASHQQFSHNDRPFILFCDDAIQKKLTILSKYYRVQRLLGCSLAREIQPLTNRSISVSLIQHTLTRDVKLNLYRLFSRSAYVHFGVSVTWPRRPDQTFFLNPPIPLQTQDSASNQQNSNLSDRRGAGLDFLTVHDWSLTLGYQYDNFGSIEVEASVLSPQTQSSFFPKGIKLSNFHLGKLMTHSMQLSERYFFG